MLDDKVAIVTGSARGLGAGIARRFAAEGAAVVCADVLDATETAGSLPAAPSGKKSEAAHLDVTDTSAVDALVDDVVERLGSIDIMMNNAGIAPPVGTIAELSDEWVDKTIAVNLKGVIACSRAAARHMMRQESGRIITTASHLGKRGWAGWGIYSATKAAVIAVTQALAVELAPYQVTVNAICPGTMVTDMMRIGFVQEAEIEGGDAEAMIREKSETLPLRRMGTPEDMGAMAAWIASEDAGFTTGAALNLTGGEAVFF